MRGEGVEDAVVRVLSPGAGGEDRGPRDVSRTGGAVNHSSLGRAGGLAHQTKAGTEGDNAQVGLLSNALLDFWSENININFSEGDREGEMCYLRRGGLNGAFGGLRCELSLSVVLRTEMPDICPGVQAMPTGVEDTELQ